MSTRIPCGYAAWLADQAQTKPSRLELRITRELQLGPATESELRRIMCISGASRPRFANALNALLAIGKVRLRPHSCHAAPSAAPSNRWMCWSWWRELNSPHRSLADR